MKLISGYENRKARIEMLPLIDVMFLILVFFIYSIFSMSVHKGLKVDLPAAEGEVQVGEICTITLTKDNKLYLNKMEMDIGLIAEQTISNWKKNQTPVLIKADKTAEIGMGIRLLGLLKAGGVEKVSFQVEE
ncbi:MAG: biopolymer transporter ExbD [Kiritimatiellia bacterium]